MNNDIELLLKLQVIDYDLGELERSKEYIPDMMANLNREIGEAREKLDTATAQLTEAKVSQRHLEVEIKAKEVDLARFQQQMMTIKTNKEYDALVAQIDAVKNEIGARERHLMETMERIESLEKLLPEITERHNQIKENNQRQLEVLQEKIDSIGGTVTSKQTERDDFLRGIPKRTMSVYERVRRGKGGSAVVPVKTRSCSACHKALTPKHIQEIRKAEGILTCENCGRLLYWDDDISDS